MPLDTRIGDTVLDPEAAGTHRLTGEDHAEAALRNRDGRERCSNFADAARSSSVDSATRTLSITPFAMRLPSLMLETPTPRAYLHRGERPQPSRPVRDEQEP
jgi:hypothetical protein